MVINATTTLVNGGVLGGTLRYLEAFVGGIFGLYLLLVILRWHESRRLVHILKDIKHDIREMSKHMGADLKERDTLIRKSKQKIKSKLKKNGFKRKKKK